MDKSTLKREVEKLLKIAKCNYKVEIDKIDDYPCVIINKLVHVAYSPTWISYRIYRRVTPWPLEIVEYRIGNKEYFALNVAVAVACKFIIDSLINSEE